MRLTVLGCSGSVSGPDSVASGYLLESPDAEPVAIDFGPGVLGVAQRFTDPGRLTVLLSHLHADHCLDVPGLLVWRRYHPEPVEGRVELWGPEGTALRIGAASAEIPGEIDDVSDTLDVRAFRDGGVERVNGYEVRTVHASHPPEAYSLRITRPGSGVLVYTGDTGYTDELVALSRGADVLLSEASWSDAPGRPEGLHMSGREAGRLAREAGVGRLLLTHIPPWTSREGVLEEARAEFDGHVHAVASGEQYEI